MQGHLLYVTGQKRGSLECTGLSCFRIVRRVTVWGAVGVRAMSIREYHEEVSSVSFLRYSPWEIDRYNCSMAVGLEARCLYCIHSVIVSCVYWSRALSRLDKRAVNYPRLSTCLLDVAIVWRYNLSPVYSPPPNGKSLIIF